MATCIGVNPKEEIILFRGNFDHAIQVAGLETRLEPQLLLFVDGRVDSLKCSVVDLILIELVVKHGILNYGYLTDR
jgi:hypothetical protein